VLQKFKAVDWFCKARQLTAWAYFYFLPALKGSKFFEQLIQKIGFQYVMDNIYETKQSNLYRLLPQNYTAVFEL
jgi:hypothetical protein